jgi:hypothetical protein
MPDNIGWLPAQTLDHFEFSFLICSSKTPKCIKLEVHMWLLCFLKAMTAFSVLTSHSAIKGKPKVQIVLLNCVQQEALKKRPGEKDMLRSPSEASDSSATSAFLTQSLQDERARLARRIQELEIDNGR